MRIACTGSEGYIGGWLVRELRERGHQVFTQDIHPGAGEVFDLGAEIPRRSWLSRRRPEMVIHLAALYGRVWGEIDLQKTAAANAGMTAELARDTAAAGARLLFVSSSEVYGSAANVPGPVMPESPLSPLNMYGLSKKWGEEACRVYAPAGLQIARLNMPYGPAAVFPDYGSVPHFSGRAGVLGYNALHTMLWQAHHSLPITVHRGTERCFTWVGDAVRGIAMVAESRWAGVWNVSRNDDMITMAALAKRCTAMVPGCGSAVTETDPGGQITMRKSLDNDRLCRLGWSPMVGLDHGMARTLDYMSHFGRNGRWNG